MLGFLEWLLSLFSADQCKESELSVSNDGRKEASALPSVEDAFTQFNPPSFLNDAKAKSKAKSVPIDDGVENSSGLAKDSCSESAPTQLGSTRQRPRIDLGVLLFPMLHFLLPPPCLSWLQYAIPSSPFFLMLMPFGSTLWQVFVNCCSYTW